MLLLFLTLLQGIPVTSHRWHVSPVTFTVLSPKDWLDSFGDQRFAKRKHSLGPRHTAFLGDPSMYVCSARCDSQVLPLSLPPLGALLNWGVDGETLWPVSIQVSCGHQAAAVSSQSTHITCYLTCNGPRPGGDGQPNDTHPVYG